LISSNLSVLFGLNLLLLLNSGFITCKNEYGLLSSFDLSCAF
jgi:hypothetical protein